MLHNAKGTVLSAMGQSSVLEHVAGCTQRFPLQALEDLVLLDVRQGAVRAHAKHVRLMALVSHRVA